MSTATATPPAPPASKSDVYDKANTLRKRFIKQLKEIPEAQQRWVLDCLKAEFPEAVK